MAGFLTVIAFWLILAVLMFAPEWLIINLIIILAVATISLVVWEVGQAIWKLH